MKKQSTCLHSFNSAFFEENEFYVACSALKQFKCSVLGLKQKKHHASKVFPSKAFDVK